MITLSFLENHLVVIDRAGDEKQYAISYQQFREAFFLFPFDKMKGKFSKLAYRSVLGGSLVFINYQIIVKHQ